MADAGAPGSRPVDEEVRTRVRCFALRLTGDEDRAEDVAQEAVARVLEAGAPTDLPYLFRVALNLVRTEARRNALRRTATGNVDRVADPRSPEPLHSMVSEEEKARFWSTLGRLPERERTALVLRFGEGLSCADVGRTLGISPNAVSCLLRRGKERMRGLLAPRSLNP